MSRFVFTIITITSMLLLTIYLVGDFGEFWVRDHGISLRWAVVNMVSSLFCLIWSILDNYKE